MVTCMWLVKTRQKLTTILSFQNKSVTAKLLFLDLWMHKCLTVYMLLCKTLLASLSWWLSGHVHTVPVLVAQWSCTHCACPGGSVVRYTLCLSWWLSGHVHTVPVLVAQWSCTHCGLSLNGYRHVLVWLDNFCWDYYCTSSIMCVTVGDI